MQQKNVYSKGLIELRGIRKCFSHYFALVCCFSICVNLLMLTGPLYMLQIYDRVLSSRSVETLTALTVLVFALFSFLGILDWARGRILARTGAKYYARLDKRVFMAVLDVSKHPYFNAKSINGLNELTRLQAMYASPALYALFDLPWVPIFVGIIFVFHPLLGWFALCAGCLLVAITYISNRSSRVANRIAKEKRTQADILAQQIIDDSEAVVGLGMQSHLMARWKAQSDIALQNDIAANDKSGGFLAFSKAFRMFIQAAILGLGALLVLRAELSAGAMIAGSILLGRALAPLDMAMMHWGVLQVARDAHFALSELLEVSPYDVAKADLPKPEALLEVCNLAVVPPGSKQACLQSISFVVKPGEALGVIGQSASGKSSLARAITKGWPIAAGEIRLGGATLDQYGSEVLGQYIGYLPQNVALFDGSIAENIAGMAQEPDMKMVVKGAKNAGAHDLILCQDDGYNTMITRNSGSLSGGQRQRIGLARALYADPLILVLDEPNSSLDSQGASALSTAIVKMKTEGKSAIIMSHRPSGIETCDTLLILQNGLPKAFGPRDEVLTKHVQNTAAIKDSFARVET